LHFAIPEKLKKNKLENQSLINADKASPFFVCQNKF